MIQQSKLHKMAIIRKQEVQLTETREEVNLKIEGYDNYY